MKRFLRGRINYNQFLAISSKYSEGVGQFFQVAIHFHPSHLQPKMSETSFCTLVRLLLTKKNTLTFPWIQRYFRAIQSDTKHTVGDIAPLKIVKISDTVRYIVHAH